MNIAQALFNFTLTSAKQVEDALYFRARMGMRGFLEVPEPKVTLTDDDCRIESVPFIWHTTMPDRATNGGRASFFDLTDEATIAQALAVKASR